MVDPQKEYQYQLAREERQKDERRGRIRTRKTSPRRHNCIFSTQYYFSTNEDIFNWTTTSVKRNTRCRDNDGCHPREISPARGRRGDRSNARDGDRTRGFSPRQTKSSVHDSSSFLILKIESSVLNHGKCEQLKYVVSSLAFRDILLFRLFGDEIRRLPGDCCSSGVFLFVGLLAGAPSTY